MQKAVSKFKLWENPLVVFFGAFGLLVSSQVAGELAVLPFAQTINNKNYQIFLSILVGTVTLFLLMAAYKNVVKFNWNSLGFRLPEAKYYLWIIPAFFVYFALTYALSTVAALFVSGFNVTQAQDVGFQALARYEVIAAFFSLVILTPIFEETILRGVLFRGLRRSIGFWLSALFTSVVFAAAHGQWNVGLDTFALSLVMCYLVEKSDSLVPAILLHAIKNFLAFAVVFLIK